MEQAGEKEDKMIKVVFNRKYHFKGFGDRVCDVELLLPADEEGYLITELRNQKVIVFGWELSKLWGHYDEENNVRYYELSVFGSSWDEVEERATTLINEALEKIRDVYKKNVEEINKAPQDAEEVYFIE